MKTNKKGFTLIELMLVIAIIGILAGAILVGMASFRNKAKASNALQTATGHARVGQVCLLGGGTLANVATFTGNICNNASIAPGLWTDGSTIPAASRCYAAATAALPARYGATVNGINIGCFIGADNSNCGYVPAAGCTFTTLP